MKALLNKLVSKTVDFNSATGKKKDKVKEKRRKKAFGIFHFFVLTVLCMHVNSERRLAKRPRRFPEERKSALVRFAGLENGFCRRANGDDGIFGVNL